MLTIGTDGRTDEQNGIFERSMLIEKRPSLERSNEEWPGDLQYEVLYS